MNTSHKTTNAVLDLEELNANNYNPIEGYGDNGHAVRLSVKDDLESEKTFGINQVKYTKVSKDPVPACCPIQSTRLSNLVQPMGERSDFHESVTSRCAAVSVPLQNVPPSAEPAQHKRHHRLPQRGLLHSNSHSCECREQVASGGSA